jgi:hypothetical protein
VQRLGEHSLGDKGSDLPPLVPEGSIVISSFVSNFVKELLKFSV